MGSERRVPPSSTVPASATASSPATRSATTAMPTPTATQPPRCSRTAAWCSPAGCAATGASRLTAPRCTTAKQRAVTRHTRRRDQTRALAGTGTYARARRRRKRIERVFGHLKRNPKLRTFKLWGLAGAAEEFTMVAAADTPTARQPTRTALNGAARSFRANTGCSVNRPQRDFFESLDRFTHS